MLAVKAPLSKAQDAKEELIKKSALNELYCSKKESGFIYFPLLNRIKTKYEIVDTELEPRIKKPKMRENLSNHLTPEEMKRLKTAADIIGTIAIIEIEDILIEKKKIIAEEFLRQNKSIKTVLMKTGGHVGELRLQKYEFLTGENTRETIHKENGCIIKLDVEKVYYSPRTATERMRIANLVKQGENVLVMFSGCAPFPCTIAKNTKAKEIIGIELNKDGHHYGLENVKLNKLKNVQLFCGDVREIIPKILKMSKQDNAFNTFDRIIMPLPRSAGDFLDIALTATKSGTIIHFYSFQKEGEFEIAADIVQHACKNAGLDCTILRIVKAGQNAPRTFRICVDALIK